MLIASEPGSADRANEDFAAAADGLMVVIDGAGAPAGLKSGCTHSVAWYARNLGGLLLAGGADPAMSLAEALAVSIEGVNALHRGTCDLGHPDSPSATVTAARVTGDRLEYLALADSVLVLDQVDQDPAVITDDRLARVIEKLDGPGHMPPVGSDDHAAGLLSRVERLASYRNRPGGFWVASSNPEAASEALVGAAPLGSLNAVALLSDGASRLADRFHLTGWAELLAVLREQGPARLIARTRAAEATDLQGVRWPRGKASDDASAVYWPVRD